jgi:hypothetical protein
MNRFLYHLTGFFFRLFVTAASLSVIAAETIAGLRHRKLCPRRKRYTLAELCDLSRTDIDSTWLEPWQALPESAEVHSEALARSEEGSCGPRDH